MLRDRERVLGEDLQGRRGGDYDTPDTPMPGAHAERQVGRHDRTMPERPAGRGMKARPRGGHPAKRPAPPAGERPKFSIDGYELMECRGKGGMGEVYRAIQKSLGREVAIKTLDLTLARHQASILRFQKEAAAMAKLRHPNIVQVIDRGTSRQYNYFVMEFVDGPSLRELLREGAFAPLEAMQIMLQLARTMAYAHKQGVIHRDLKPENILYTSEGVLKVADFGLAGVEYETTYIRKLTRSFVSMGTECYMAPEQRRDAKNVDFRADLFSMGVIFYELLTNQIPFPQMPPAHVPIAPGYPEIDRIIRRCLEPSPEDRYSSTEALVHVLEETLDLIQAAPLEHRDTVIDTPGVSPALEEGGVAEDSEELVGVIEGRVSGWMRSAISSASEQVSLSWRRGALRKFFLSAGMIAGVGVLVGLFFWLSPAPPAPKLSPKERAALVWKIPAQLQRLSDQRASLAFSFSTKGLPQGWSRRPRLQWSLQGNWSATSKQIEQNTYQHSVILNHRPCWAVYKGHTLRGAPLVLRADVAILPPRVPVPNKGWMPLRDFLRTAMPSIRDARRYPTVGIGLRGSEGEQAAVFLKPRGTRIAYTFVVRSAGLPKKVEAGVLRRRFRYGSFLQLKLLRTTTAMAFSINGRQIEQLRLSPKEQWSGHAGLICRDAHCAFQNLRIQAFAEKRAK